MKELLIARSLAVSGAAILGVAAMSPAAFAQSTQTQTYQANLSSLNNSGAKGTATVSVNGNQVTVKINSTGLSANLPHAQHIHIGGKNTCPTMSDGSKVNGVQVLNTVQGQPSYGSIKVSLTTSGDTSASSGLAVNRFPTASKSGDVTYSRTFTLPKGVSASDIAHGVIVQHGVASIFGNKTKYDGSAKSKLDKSLPLEETVPADCGVLTAVGGKGAGPVATKPAAPTGAPNTGSGSTAGIQDTTLFAIGGAAIILAGASLFITRRAAERD